MPLQEITPLFSPTEADSFASPDVLLANTIIEQDLVHRARIIANRPNQDQDPQDYFFNLLYERYADIQNGYQEGPEDPRLQQLMVGYTHVVLKTIDAYGWPGIYDRSDVYLLGQYGLYKALLGYNPNKGGFIAHLTQAIHRAVVDEYRAVSPGSIKLSRNHHKLRKDIDKIQADYPNISDEELAEKLAMPDDQFLAMRRDMTMLDVSSLNTASNKDEVSSERLQPPYANSAPNDPEAAAIEVDMQSWISKILAETPLSPNQRYIFNSYFLQGTTLKAIGEEIGVTESRVSQLVRGIITALRNDPKVREAYNELTTA